ncbi:hypothetical protein [Thiothrix nivea]|uniref:Uncharacterized protein n=1 Tax=Thiothrix nivea (strain ATCC 35100 / DSM 5205 / JP2) TaxID=870187 RepID=A0A656HHJ6_THINJ|nr:hypothetical protein [Thiothrix nivea]EIJ35897.1 hypothetical protein Thini_3385 [Thiothrix nivea DSM 5205]
MNDLVARTYCVVPSEVLKALLFAGVVGLVFVSIVKLMGVEVPATLVVGLVGFFFAGAILVSHGLSILRKPGLILLVGTVSIVTTVQLQNAILSII